MSQRSRLAIIAHDGKKADLVAFAAFNRERLAEFQLVATSSTGKLLADKVGLEVECLESGPVGGDVQMANRVVEGDVDAVICLGCVIKGETAHFEHVAEAAARGILDVSLESGVPCVFGVLTTYTEEQARARADKGREAAETAVEMANLLRSVRK